jgi:hypothetical protein
LNELSVNFEESLLGVLENLEGKSSGGWRERCFLLKAVGFNASNRKNSRKALRFHVRNGKSTDKDHKVTSRQFKVLSKKKTIK